MRQMILIGTLALALLSSTAPANAAHRRHAASVRCPVGHARLVAADTQAEVFKAENSVPVPAIYGCVYGSRRTYELGIVSNCASASMGGCGGISLVGLGGTIVAYEENLGGSVSGNWVVVVRDLRTGRVLRKLPTSRSPAAGLPKAIVVKSDGAVAWIVGTRVATSHSMAEFEVYASDSAGTRLLASGPGIEPSSLALAGSTVYWTQEGHPASALLS